MKISTEETRVSSRQKKNLSDKCILRRKNASSNRKRRTRRIGRRKTKGYIYDGKRIVRKNRAREEGKMDRERERVFESVWQCDEFD